MIIKCVKCGKMYDEEKYYGICPKCGRYNREESAGEKEHQELHNKYDDGYSHTEDDNHHRFHEAYDNSYSHAQTQGSDTVPAQATSASVRPASAQTAPMQQTAQKPPITPSGQSQTSGQRTTNKVLKIVLFIILLQFGIQIVFALLGIFLSI